LFYLCSTNLGPKASLHTSKYLVDRITQQDSLSAIQILFNLERLHAEHAQILDIAHPEIVSEITKKLVEAPTQALVCFLDYFFDSESLGGAKIDYVHVEVKTQEIPVTGKKNSGVVSSPSTTLDDDDEWDVEASTASLAPPSGTKATLSTLDDEWGLAATAETKGDGQAPSPSPSPEEEDEWGPAATAETKGDWQAPSPSPSPEEEDEWGSFATSKEAVPVAGTVDDDDWGEWEASTPQDNNNSP
jgi:hypothetical protein